VAGAAEEAKHDVAAANSIEVKCGVDGGASDEPRRRLAELERRFGGCHDALRARSTADVNLTRSQGTVIAPGVHPRLINRTGSESLIALHPPGQEPCNETANAASERLSGLFLARFGRPLQVVLTCFGPKDGPNSSRFLEKTARYLRFFDRILKAASLPDLAIARLG
jgi:hypothetical protein